MFNSCSFVRGALLQCSSMCFCCWSRDPLSASANSVFLTMTKRKATVTLCVNCRYSTTVQRNDMCEWRRLYSRLEFTHVWLRHDVFHRSDMCTRSANMFCLLLISETFQSNSFSEIMKLFVSSPASKKDNILSRKSILSSTNVFWSGSLHVTYNKRLETDATAGGCKISLESFDTRGKVVKTCCE